jgi:hypothetical protein
LLQISAIQRKKADLSDDLNPNKESDVKIVQTEENNESSKDSSGKVKKKDAGTITAAAEAQTQTKTADLPCTEKNQEVAKSTTSQRKVNPSLKGNKSIPTLKPAKSSSRRGFKQLPVQTFNLNSLNTLDKREVAI